MRTALILVCGLLVVSSVARAEVQEGGVVTFPAPALERLVIRHPQGPLVLRGWDRPEIHIGFLKRAPRVAMLDLLRVRVDVRDGQVVIRSGIETRGELRALPQPDSAIELTIDAPRQAHLVAGTFSGDLRASGFNNGLDLDTHTGTLRVSDVAGPLHTHTGQGDQWIRSIQGEVSATGVDGEMEVAAIEGPSLTAQVVRGRIIARDLHVPVVELQAAVGTLILMGALVPGGKYALRVDEGDVQVLLPDRPALRFTLDAQAQNTTVDPRFALDRGAVERPGSLHGDFHGGGPLLQVETALGRVSVQPAL